jgi:plasmid stability protein
MTTITVKNIPDDIYHSLKNAAQAHHRSLNSEILACLEKTLLPMRVSSDERLMRARRLRESLATTTFQAQDIEEAIEQGRL